MRSDAQHAEPAQHQTIETYLRIRPSPQSAQLVSLNEDDSTAEFSVTRDAAVGCAVASDGRTRNTCMLPAACSRQVDVLLVRHINNKREQHKFQFHGILEPDADQEAVRRSSRSYSKQDLWILLEARLLDASSVALSCTTHVSPRSSN